MCRRPTWRALAGWRTRALGAFAEVLPEADLVVLIGKKLDFMLKFGREPTFSRDCKFVQIDAEGPAVAQTQAVVGDSRRVALEVVADSEAASRRLLAQAGGFRPQHSGWADEVRDAIAFRPRSWQDLESDENGALHPVQVCREIQKLLGDGGVFVSDGGEFGQWAQACINCSGAADQRPFRGHRQFDTVRHSGQAGPPGGAHRSHPR